MTKLFQIIFISLIVCGSGFATDRYVSLTGTNDAAGGYTNWAGAATNIQDAVDVATNGETVWVTNGTYNILHPAVAGGDYWAGVYITNSITLKSVNGATNTIINGNYGVTTGRCVYVIGGGVVDGFTISNGYAFKDWISPGVILAVRGGGVYMYKSTVRNCIIKKNFAVWSGGGVYMYGGDTHDTLLDNCIISDNTHATEGCGGIAAMGCTGSERNIIRNCLITRNVGVLTTNGGGGVWLTCGSIYNCTIVSNCATAGAGGGLYASDVGTSNQIFNNIIYYNTSTNAADNNYWGTNAIFANNCTFPAVTGGKPGSANNITNEPLFMNTNSANYRLSANSPCINIGTNQTWMTNAVDWDGNPRIIGPSVDMGVYEYAALLLLLQPQSVTNNPGLPAMFSISAQGLAPLYYQWQKDRINISGATATNYTIGSVQETDEGTYRCVVTHMAGSTTSSVASLTVNDLPAMPERMSASDGTYTDKVLITWGVASGATGYQIFRHMSNNSASADQIGTATSITYDDTGAVAGTTYYYWVKATNTAGTSAFSVSDFGYLGSSVTILAVPTGLSASDGTYSNLVRVTWNTVTGTLYYELWRNTSNNSASASNLAQTTNSVTYADATVTAGMSYCYWVKAKNAQTTSAFSDPDSGYAALNAVSGYANLEVSDVILLPTTLSVGGHPGAAGIQLMNWGPSDMTTPNTRVILDFFLSKNTTFENKDDLWLGDYTTDVTLPAGSYTFVAVTASARKGFVVPSGAVGTNYVFARARHTYPSTLEDSDESNNYAMRTGTIRVAGSNDMPSAGYHLINDYDGDGMSDFAFYKEVTGEWMLMLSGSGYAPVQFVLGGKDYQPVIADYDGDGEADPAVCNQKTGEWKALLSASEYSMLTFTFGGHTETPVPIDYDGDGKADPAIYQQSGDWVMLLSGSDYAAQTMTLGGNNYVPVPADYDGDGISDLAVYRSSTGDWELKLSMMDYWTVNFRFGGSGAIPVPADYDGDGQADPAVYKEASGNWSLMMSRFGYLTAGATFGGQGWVPVAADYDGDGKEDIAIYNDNQHLLKVLVSSSDYGMITLDVGGPGYEPVGWPR